MFENERDGSLATFRKVMKYIGQYKILLFISVFLAGVSVITTLYAPILFGDAIDCIVEKGNVDFVSIAQILRKIGILIAVTSIATWIMNVINNRLTFKVVEDIRAQAIRKLQHLPLSYLDRHSTGDIVGRIIADVDQLSDGLLLGFSRLFSGVITIVATLFFMFNKSIPITVMVVILTPISFLVARFIATRSYQMFRKQTDTRGTQTALIEEMVGNEKIVKAFGYEKRSSQRFQKINGMLQEYSQKAIFFSSLTNPCTRAVNNVTYACVALFGAYLCLQNSLTVGGLSTLLAYANQYMKPFNDISSVITELQNALACANRVFELIESEPEVAEQTDVMDQASGKVHIENVDFSYNKDTRLIENFNLDVEPGMRIAIVGPTGCGKTTFINLLMRFYDVDEGSIQLDSKDIRSVTRHSLRANYGMVLQETWLKTGTVRENIAIGKPAATDEELIQACKEAHSWSFIRRLPKGLDTEIDDNSLSQGQKQLLCITRVMLCLPPILILDEATSSIDTRTELRVQSAFDKLMTGRTSFVVAHRLSTIRNADVILVMRDGKIIEQGNHDTLMAQNGFYTNLYNSQFVKTA